MKQKLLSPLVIFMICLVATSCIKDAPIYPDDPDFVPYTGKGGTGGGGGGGAVSGTVNLTFLSGDWEVTAMYTEIYSASNVVQLSTLSLFNLYRGVDLNNTTKAYLFDGSFDAVDPGVFTTSTVGSSVYIQLQEDPFNRTVNDKIQITNLTANSMTWLAIDPEVSSTPGGNLKTGFKVVYTRKP